jgi:hypothetical protein
MKAESPAGKLVRAFGKVAEMAKAYAPDIQWSLPASTPFPRPMIGREAVIAFNNQVWGQVHYPDCEVEILDEVGDETASAVRFLYRARVIGKEGVYENEYTVFVRSGSEGLKEVFEAFDTVAALDFYRDGKTTMRGVADA